MLNAPCQELPPPGLLSAIEEYNQGKFFQSHKTLENLWMAETGPIRGLYQGILQIGVAFLHLEAGRYRPVVTLLEGGSRYLQRCAPVCLGVDVDRLLAGAACCLTELKRLGPGGLGDFDWRLVPDIEMRRGMWGA